MHKMTAAGMALFVALSVPALCGCGRSAAAGPRPQIDVALKIREKLTSGAAEGGASEAAASTGTGWATLKGTFKYVGAPPSPRPLNVDKDTEVCGRGGALMDNSLLVDSNGGIANVVLYARAKRVHESAQPLAEGAMGEVVFDQKNCMFLSHVLAFQVGEKVDIRNSDPVGHNTKIDPRNGVAFNQNLPAGQSAPYVATAEEALPAAVSCSIHPWMRAYMLPRKDKYFAVTKPDGSFELPNLPAGEDVEIQVWHEHGTGPGGALVLDRKDLKWTNKGRFKVRLEADQPMDLALEVPAGALSVK
jgi:hypothetical protein